MENTLEIFEKIIRSQRAEELVAFLLALDEPAIAAIRQRVQPLAPERAGFRQQGEQPGEHGPARLPQALLFLTRLATYSSKEALAPAFAASLRVLNQPVEATGQQGCLAPPALVAYACRLLSHRRPEWLDAWLGNTADSRAWRGLDFGLLLELERRGLIVPTDRLLAISGVGELVSHGAEAKTFWQLHGYVKAQVQLTPSQVARYAQLTRAFSWLRAGEPLPAIEDLIYERLARNKPLLARAVPLFFEVDTEISWRLAAPVGQAAGKRLAWHTMLARLAASGHLERADLLTRCLLALGRNFRRPLLAWFRALFLALKPTFTERLARQSALTALLAHPQPLVVSFARAQLHDMRTEPGFNLAPLLRSAQSQPARLAGRAKIG